MREELDNVKQQRAKEFEERNELARQLKELQLNKADVTDGPVR